MPNQLTSLKNITANSIMKHLIWEVNREKLSRTLPRELHELLVSKNKEKFFIDCFNEINKSKQNMEKFIKKAGIRLPDNYSVIHIKMKRCEDGQYDIVIDNTYVNFKAEKATMSEQKLMDSIVETISELAPKPTPSKLTTYHCSG
ncbi:Uncharacterised protein [Legionella steigerwaltii]|uniref:Uncharacterized protein n=2 Tax=Legionella steigerwaltii TaxID=460 RepID=A0A378LDY4_9GAMM|nr:hypothetical protein [Legionella steigerwaltii]KTD76216.1 hypothetical protein Lstg_2309 [Legionella steigerwaltii]STY22301.1 Uncharacterised protein [Legionella steigerwaltii]